jgi:hypothetical protein
MVSYLVMLSALCFISKVAGYFSISTVKNTWSTSANLTNWYNDYDLCVVHSTISESADAVIKECETKSVSKSSLPPMRCRAGNSWPSKSAYCSPSDITFEKRLSFTRSVDGLDDYHANFLRRFFKALSEEESALILVGDSVMQQFFNGIACELERVGIWKDSSKFTNTDEVQYVRVTANGTAVPIFFLPIYHLVNSRFDRIPNAAMHKLETTLAAAIQKHQGLTIMVNMGLHYIENPVPNFSRIDYQHQMTTVLSYLHNFALSHSKKNVRIFWRETSAQHFPTPNGYWPGAKYASSMKLTCVPLQDASAAADWRNSDVAKIINASRLFMVQTIPFYKVTAPLWDMHPSGHLQDCTHFCW